MEQRAQRGNETKPKKQLTYIRCRCEDQGVEGVCRLTSHLDQYDPSNHKLWTRVS